MKTVSAIFMVLPAAFWAMAFAYGQYDELAHPFLGGLSLLSTLACLGWAYFLRRKHLRLARACVAVGCLYFVLLVVVPVVAIMLTPPRTRGRAGAEPPGFSTIMPVRSVPGRITDAAFTLRLSPLSVGR